jgi:hypothetical protein
MAIPEIVQPATGLGGGLNIGINDVNGPASYVTGGVLVSASQIGLAAVKFAEPMGLSSDGLNFCKIISPSGKSSATFKILWFVQATGAEVANATPLNTKKIRCFGLGI